MLRISADKDRANAMARSDLPDAVGPTMTQRLQKSAITATHCQLCRKQRTTANTLSQSKRLEHRRLRRQSPLRRSGTTFDYKHSAAAARVASAINSIFIGETIMALPILVRRGFTDPIEYGQRDFNNMLSNFFSNQQDGGQLAPFGVDVREDADHIYVEADLPGFKKEEVEITLENQTLTIAAEHKEEHEEKGGMLLP